MDGPDQRPLFLSFFLSRCPYCDYRGTSSSLLIHHKRGRHKAELELEMLEKERQRIAVPIEVQQRAAEAAGT